MRNCPDCKEDWPEDRFNGKDPECFRCRTRNIGVTFAGGRHNFNGHTKKEYVDKAFADAKRNGYEIAPAGQTTFTGGVGAQIPKIKSALTSKATT